MLFPGRSFFVKGVCCTLCPVAKGALIPLHPRPPPPTPPLALFALDRALFCHQTSTIFLIFDHVSEGSVDRSTCCIRSFPLPQATMILRSTSMMTTHKKLSKQTNKKPRPSLMSLGLSYKEQASCLVTVAGRAAKRRIRAMKECQRKRARPARCADCR